jgi:hypothetical protein
LVVRIFHKGAGVCRRSACVNRSPLVSEI